MSKRCSLLAPALALLGACHDTPEPLALPPDGHTAAISGALAPAVSGRSFPAPLLGSRTARSTGSRPVNTSSFGIAVLLGFALLGGSPLVTPAEAQQRTTVREGERIRVTQLDQPPAARPAGSWPGRALGIAVDLLVGRPIDPSANRRIVSGTLLAAHVDSLVVEVAPGWAPVAVPTSTVVYVDVHRRTAGLVRPTLIGAGAGAVTLMLLPAPCFGWCPPPSRSEMLELAAVGAFFGGATGAAYGLLHPWKRLRLPLTPTVGVVDAGSAAAGVRISL